MRQHRNPVYVVTADCNGLDLPGFIARVDPHLDRNAAIQLVRRGGVTIDGHGVYRITTRVQRGQHVSCHIPLEPPRRPVAQAIDLPVLYEDEHLIAINKPPGVATHPSPGQPDGTVINALGDHLRDAGGDDPQRPGVVHRLDMDTSGVLVLARSRVAYESLVAQFSSREVTKRYIAVVYGRVDERIAQIDAPIGSHHHPRRRAMQVVRDDGQEAITDVQVVEHFGDAFTRLECRPLTGRTHQIRVHLRHVGHPVVADPTYGGGHRLPRFSDYGLPVELREGLAPDADPDVVMHRQALHAASIRLRHPLSNLPIFIAAPLPDDMTLLLDVIRHTDRRRRRGDNPAA
ncbi:MAG: RluA family pseudouridine synthase [Planctomycetota bacterium]